MQIQKSRKRRLNGICHGPLPSLQQHLQGDWWSELFDSVYLKTDRDVLDNQDNTASDIDLVIQTTGISRTDRVLDLCCGQGRHCIELSARGFQSVAGVDQSRFLIWLARRRARREGMAIRFEQGDIRTHCLPPDSADCITVLGNSFGYFEDPEDDAIALAKIRRALSPGGQFVLDIPDGAWVRENFESRSWEWINGHQFVCRERSLNEEGTRLIAREMIADTKRGVLRDQFYSERLYSRQEIAAIMEQAEFSGIRFHEEWDTQSDRNQDLGLMEHRLFLTATGG